MTIGGMAWRYYIRLEPEIRNSPNMNTSPEYVGLQYRLISTPIRYDYDDPTTKTSNLLLK